MEKFLTWLEEELKHRDWQPADLARKAALGSGTVHRILNGERKAGPEVAVAIARALGEPPEKVFRLAGLLPPAPEPSPRENDLMHIFRNLSPGQQKTVVDMLRGLSGQPGMVREERRTEYQVRPPEEGQVRFNPGLEDIMDLLQGLDEAELLNVYDFVVYRQHEQKRRRDSFGHRREPDRSLAERLEQEVEKLSSAEREYWLNVILARRGGRDADPDKPRES